MGFLIRLIRKSRLPSVERRKGGINGHEKGMERKKGEKERRKKEISLKTDSQRPSIPSPILARPCRTLPHRKEARTSRTESN